MNTIEKTYHGYPIMTDKERELTCDTKVLNEIERQFDYAKENKSKIFFTHWSDKTRHE